MSLPDDVPRHLRLALVNAERESPDCVNGAAGSGPLSPRHNLAESRGDAMTPEEQIAWLREEVAEQIETGEHLKEKTP